MLPSATYAREGSLSGTAFVRFAKPPSCQTNGRSPYFSISATDVPTSPAGWGGGMIVICRECASCAGDEDAAPDRKRADRKIFCRRGVRDRISKIEQHDLDELTGARTRAFGKLLCRRPCLGTQKDQTAMTVMGLSHCSSPTWRALFDEADVDLSM
jgi:hypothetical protein